MSLLGIVGRSFGGSEITPAAPATPALAVVDNGDLSITATITGSSTGSSNSIEYSRWSAAEEESAAWSSGGTRSGDGDVTFSLAAGLYFFRAVSTLNAQNVGSTIVFVRVFSTVDPVHERILVAVRDVVRTLSLPGITSANVKLLTTPEVRGDSGSTSQIIISPADSESWDWNSASNVRDDIGYPVLIAAVTPADRDFQNLQAQRKVVLGWRQDVFRMFRNQRLAAVPETWRINVVPKDIVNAASWHGPQNLFVWGLMLNVVSREERGV